MTKLSKSIGNYLFCGSSTNHVAWALWLVGYEMIFQGKQIPPMKDCHQVIFAYGVWHSMKEKKLRSVLIMVPSKDDLRAHVEPSEFYSLMRDTSCPLNIELDRE
jgi:hypothetical protein